MNAMPYFTSNVLALLTRIYRDGKQISKKKN